MVVGQFAFLAGLSILLVSYLVPLLIWQLRLDPAARSAAQAMAKPGLKKLHGSRLSC